MCKVNIVLSVSADPYALQYPCSGVTRISTSTYTSHKTNNLIRGSSWKPNTLLWQTRLMFFSGMRHFSQIQKILGYSFFPSETLHSEEVMVFGCKIQYPVSEIIRRSSFMSRLVSNVLNGKDTFGKYYQSFKTFVTLSMDDWYMSLHNIMIMVHPVLIQHTVGFKITKQGHYNPLIVHVNNVMTFAER